MNGVEVKSKVGTKFDLMTIILVPILKLKTDIGDWMRTLLEGWWIDDESADTIWWYYVIFQIKRRLEKGDFGHIAGECNAKERKIVNGFVTLSKGKHELIFK